MNPTPIKQKHGDPAPKKRENGAHKEAQKTQQTPKEIQKPARFPFFRVCVLWMCMCQKGISGLSILNL
jgi:hypothetical protein